MRKKPGYPGSLGEKGVAGQKIRPLGYDELPKGYRLERDLLPSRAMTPVTWVSLRVVWTPSLSLSPPTPALAPSQRNYSAAEKPKNIWPQYGEETSVPPCPQPWLHLYLALSPCH